LSVKRCFEINTLGTYYSAQLAAKHMTHQQKLPGAEGKGSIILIASISAHQASKAQYQSDYCSSKGGVLSLAKELGVELAASEIRVNALSPGYIMTDMTLDLANQIPELSNIFNNRPPVGRMGVRKDLKGAAVFMLSDASAYMTGSEMMITGGIHAGRIL